MFHFEAERRGWVGDDPRQTARVQCALFEVELPAAVLLCLKTALQAVGQTAHRAFERLKLLVQIGAQALQLDRLGQFFGGNLFVVGGVKHHIVRVRFGNRRRGRRIERRFAVWHFRLIGHFILSHVIHGDLRLRHVLLLFLRLFRAGLSVFLVAVVLTLAVRIVLLFRLFFGFVFLILDVIRVIAQLITVAEIVDDLTGKFGKGLLVGQQLLQVSKVLACALLDVAAPQVHHIGRRRGQVAPGGQMTDQIARCHGQRRLLCGGHVAIPTSGGFLTDFHVDIGRGAGHVTCAHTFAARGFHRLVKIAGNSLTGRIAHVCGVIVIFALQRQRIGGAACQKHLVAGHAAADLGQADAVPGHAGGINRVGYRQFRIVGHNFGGLSQGLFKRISGVVVGLLSH
mmetsp:Transcript_18272/g.29013  ORF Transcript_18272/g.29013 Transcript_18272/m.29013 type:complete len:398 (-) Transcript_18272:1240-2433(-)